MMEEIPTALGSQDPELGAGEHSQLGGEDGGWDRGVGWS